MSLPFGILRYRLPLAGSGAGGYSERSEPRKLNRATGGARAALRFAGGMSGGIPCATVALFNTFKIRH